MSDADTPQPSLRERLGDVFWTRHSNPWSAGTRMTLLPILVYALYHRRWRLLAAALVFTVVNPVLFPPPERTDTWLSYAVLAEREWLESGNGTVGLDYPNVLNLLNAPVSLYTFYAAWRRRPLGAILGTAVTMGLKLLWIDELVRRTGVADHVG